MAKRILIRKDTSTNWATNNPILYPGELGIELDTLKIKVGPLVSAPNVGTAWNSITEYVNVTSNSLNSTIENYILISDLGTPSGPASLDGFGNVPLEQLGNVTDLIPDALPNQAGNENKYLKTDGANAYWAEAATAVPHPFAMIG